VFGRQPRKAVIGEVDALGLQDLWYVVFADVSIASHQTFTTLECFFDIVCTCHNVVKYGTVLAQFSLGKLAHMDWLRWTHLLAIYLDAVAQEQMPQMVKLVELAT
jgi:hypothetical protein